jgi:PAS domain S-box-containing protein
MGADSLEETVQRVKAAGKPSKKRHGETEGISRDLALELSKIFDALRKISAGDVHVRLEEAADLELVAQLKHQVNLTAENLAEIIELSHEIAIGLAEHFDVLSRVTKGDLSARVSGHSTVEPIQALDRLVNDMIESVSTEISSRKEAEEALKGVRDQLEDRVERRTAELTAANELLKQEITERKRVMEALRKSEERYHSVVEDQTELICRFKPDGKLTFVNNAYCRYFGKETNELLGRQFIPHVLGENRSDVERFLAAIGAKNGVESQEHSIVGADGEIRWQQWSIRPVCDEQGGPVEFQAVGRDITGRKRAEERLLLYHRRLRSLASTLSLAEQQERRRIATEVHDHIGQNLAFAKIKLGTVLASSPSDELRQEVDTVVKLVDEAIQDTRALVSELGSPILYELGFVPAVEWLAQQMRKRHGIVTDFEDDGHLKPLSDDVRVLLFQAVRELLANVVRHSEARTAKVSIVKNGNQIRVDVEDDGIGFNLAEVGPSADQNARFGLFSIRERLEPLGGQINAVSEPGKGTRVTLNGPLNPEE